VATAMFTASADYLSSYGPLQQTLKAARVAMWTMHWQMRGLQAAVPSVSDRELTGRFAEGSGVNGADFGESFVRRDWADIDAELTRILLVDVIAHYEGFCESLGDAVGKHQRQIKGPDVAQSDAPTSAELAQVLEGQLKADRKATRKLSDQLQFPTEAGSDKGISAALIALRAAGLERTWRTTIGTRLRQQGPVTGFLDARMLVYRAFKEARNAIAHKGNRAGEQVVSSYTAYTMVQPADLGMQVMPELPSTSLGERINLTWYGAIGLADMLRRTVKAVDGALADTEIATLELASRFRQDSSLHIVDLPGKIRRDKAGNWLVADSDADRSKAVRAGLFHLLADLELSKVEPVVTPVLRSKGVLLAAPNRAQRKRAAQ